jgi:hypothetical protein
VLYTSKHDARKAVTLRRDTNHAAKGYSHSFRRHTISAGQYARDKLHKKID